MNKDNGILDELRDLSPTLAALKKEESQPFRVPDGYFSQLTTEVFALVETGMADGVGKDAFKVPDNYFAGLTDHIMDSIEESEVAETGRVVNLRQARRREPIPIRRWTTMAAAVAVFILAGILSARFITGDSQTTAPSMTLAADDVYEYLEENIAYLDNEDLLAMVNLTDADMSIGISDELEDELHHYLEENIDELEDYLINAEI